MPASSLLLALATIAADPIVVVPPETAAADAGWIGEAVAELLPRALTLLGVPAAERTERLEAQELLEIPPVPLSRATSIRIAEAMGASSLVVGTYGLQGGALSISLRALDLERGVLSAPFVAAGPVDNLPGLVQDLAWDLALAGSTPPARKRDDPAARLPEVPFEALKAYTQALATRDAAGRGRLLQQALELKPDYDEARLTLGRSQLQARDFAAARASFSKIADGTPLARLARFLEGVALLELGRYREASAIYERLGAEAASPAVLNNRAIALLRLGGKGSPLLRKAAELDPQSADLSFNLAWALLAEGEPEAAAFWLRGLTKQEPRDAHARVMLAWALRLSGREEQSVEEWKAVAALSPSFQGLETPDLKRRFERIQVNERPLVLEREERTSAEVAATHVLRAEKLAEAGDASAAFSELTRAAYLDPYSSRVHLLLGRAHRSRGDADEALGELRMSLWCRDDAAVRAELSQYLAQLGRTAEAKEEAQRVLKADPENAAAKQVLGLAPGEPVR
jgi:tetratricopeptide (TPR) repeat protein